MTEEVEIRQYDSTYLECRDMMHAWKTVGYYNAGSCVERLLVCQRCRMQALDFLDQNGVKVRSRRYLYPDDYQVEGGYEKSDVRAERLRRTKVYASEATMRAALKRSTATKQVPARQRQLRVAS